jgi:hypothetical protein
MCKSHLLCYMYWKHERKRHPKRFQEYNFVFDAVKGERVFPVGPLLAEGTSPFIGGIAFVKYRSILPPILFTRLLLGFSFDSIPKIC